MRDLTAQEFALAIAIAVSARRTRMPRDRRLRSTYLDDCFAILDLRELNPKLRRFTASGIVRLKDAKRARLCEETRAIYEAIAPVVRELTEEMDAHDVIDHPPLRAVGRARSAEKPSADPATPNAGGR